MVESQSESLAETPLAALHRELGGRMVGFAGYALPVQYPAGIMAEHLHCRSAAALFDVSHMGQAELRGEGAAAALEALTPADVAGLKPGRQRYGLFTNAEGGILDDLMFANRGDHMLVVVNAACKEADVAHMRAHLSDVAEVEFVARYRVAGKAVRLHERSRFVREAGRWFYVDGDLLA